MEGCDLIQEVVRGLIAGGLQEGERGGKMERRIIASIALCLPFLVPLFSSHSG